MATLNIKSLPDNLHDKLKARAKRERRSVAQEVISLLGSALDQPEALSIMDLRGLGAALWHDVDPAAHVEAERTAWD